MNRAVSLSLLALCGACALASSASGQDAPSFGPPPGARPGECYGRARLPGPAQVWRERVAVSRGGLVERTIPATVRWETRRVLVRAAWAETVRTPAVWRTVYDRVVEPGREAWVSTPARYRRVETRVLVEPAHTVWRRRVSPRFSPGAEPGAETLIPTGEVLCRVKVPARYAVRVREVMVAPPGRRRIAGPPCVRRVPRRVLVRPAGETRREHSATYRVERHCVVVRPARVERVRLPAEWRTVEHVRSGDREGWARVLCPDGLAPWAMQRLQASLNAQGYAAGPADGVGRPQTYGALRRFQHDHRLAEGPITAESARALGVTP